MPLLNIDRAQHLLVPLHRHGDGQHHVRPAVGPADPPDIAADLARQRLQHVGIILCRRVLLGGICGQMFALRHGIDDVVVKRDADFRRAVAVAQRRQFLDLHHALRSAQHAAVGDQLSRWGEQARARVGRLHQTPDLCRANS